MTIERKEQTMTEPTLHASRRRHLARLIEQGNGFDAEAGSLVYDGAELYRVSRTYGTIHTGAAGQGNYVYARVQRATIDPWSLSDEEWDALPTVRCELEA